MSAAKIAAILRFMNGNPGSNLRRQNAVSDGVTQPCSSARHIVTGADSACFCSRFGLRRSVHRGRGDLALYVPVLIEPPKREVELVAFLLGELGLHLGDRFGELGAVE